MKPHFAIAVSVLLLPPVAGQYCVPSVTVEPSPSGTPVPGDYTDQYRPQIHFSPPQGFMNDPNGMFRDAKGTYHFYYQLNPTALVAGNQHWGHATSEDLYHWTNQPIALAPDNNNEQIFSGSAVVDPDNTSGFFPNQTDGVVALYTLNTLEPAAQTQHLAYSRDGGYTFTKYPGAIIDAQSAQHRDPKAFWHAPTQKWVAVVAYSMEYTASFYTSPDLKTWTFASNFTGAGFEGLQWECPNLVEVPVVQNVSAENPSDSANIAETKWLFFLSVNPGAPQGGSISWYLVGDFNGTHFLPADGVTRFSDYFKDNYAGQFFYNIPPTSPQVQMAWASNWQYTNDLPTTANKWRSVASLPRHVFLTNTTRLPYSLVQEPYPYASLYASSAPLASSDALANSSLAVALSADAVPAGALAFTVNATGIPPPARAPRGGFNFSLVASATGEVLRGGFVIAGDAGVWLDRSGLQGYTAAENPFFTGQFSIAYPVNGDTRAVSMTVVFDRSIVEVFVDGGVRVGTAVVFPKGTFDFLTIASEVDVGVKVSAEAWALKSTWDGSGGGNSTQTMKFRL